MEDLQPSELPGRTKNYSSAFILLQYKRGDESKSFSHQLLCQNHWGLSSRGVKKKKRILLWIREYHTNTRRFTHTDLSSLPTNYSETGIPKAPQISVAPASSPSVSNRALFGFQFPFSEGYISSSLIGNRASLKTASFHQGGFNHSILANFQPR